MKIIIHDNVTVTGAILLPNFFFLTYYKKLYFNLEQIDTK